MALWKASCPGFWACAPHYPLHPLLPNDSSCKHSSYPEPANQRWRRMLSPCQSVAHSLALSGHSESQCRPLCLGWDLFKRCSDGGCVCVHVHLCLCAWVCYAFKSLFWRGMCCWAHRCFFQRRVSVEKSWEKDASQVHVLEAHWVWVAPRCPLNKITAFTRPLLFLWECSTINKRGGWFFSLSLGKKTQVSLRWRILFKTDSLPHTEFTWATALDEREIYLWKNIADNISFLCRWKPI